MRGQQCPKTDIERSKCIKAYCIHMDTISTLLYTFGHWGLILVINGHICTWVAGFEQQRLKMARIGQILTGVFIYRQKNKRGRRTGNPQVPIPPKGGIEGGGASCD